jgi:hypothetical protein
MASGIVNSVTSNIISTTTSTAAKPVIALPQHDRRVEQLEKRALNATMMEAGVSVDFTKKFEFTQPPDIVPPDADNDSLGTSRKDTALSREATADTGNKMQPPVATPRLHPEVVAPLNNDCSAAQGYEVANLTRNGVTDIKPCNAIPEPVDHTLTQKEVKDYRKQRYCENCRGFFENFEKV